MLNTDHFKNYPSLLPLVSKCNKLLSSKDRFLNASRLLDNLMILLSDQEFIIPSSYIISVIAEHKPEVLPHHIFEDIKPLLHYSI